MMTTPVVFLIIIAAMIFGFVVGRISKGKQHGVFVLDDSDDADARWTLQLFVDPDDLPNGKNAHFKVIHENQRSCE